MKMFAHTQPIKNKTAKNPQHILASCCLSMHDENDTYSNKEQQGGLVTA